MGHLGEGRVLPLYGTLRWAPVKTISTDLSLILDENTSWWMGHNVVDRYTPIDQLYAGPISPQYCKDNDIFLPLAMIMRRNIGI